ncbi:hypothetical protein [Flagellimonas sp. HSM57]|uniref:hypothetical protein n=1 Tax=Flagellimonas sp. HSM57 TaxID=2654675 RepID=UPI0013D20A97|nr:hypothetical protein [Flagellimonas sp. HSM57]
MGIFRGFVTICFALSKLTKSQTPYKQGLCRAKWIRNAAPARYPLALPFFPLVKIPSHLTKKSDAFFKEFTFRPIVYIDVYGISGKSNQKRGLTVLKKMLYSAS